MNDLGEPQEDVEDEHTEQKVINEEYKMWKKNTPFLYDAIYSRALEWPTLTVQWLPDKQSIPNSSVSSHRIILGTQTSDKAQNYLQIAKIEWPNPISADTLDYDEAKEELGGHGKAKVSITFNIIQRINHPGDVNRARYQPQNPNIIATMCEDGNALVFDRSKLASIPKDNGMVEAHAILKGHEAEGYGLGWNPNEEGILATGAEDSTVRLWDLKKDFSQSSKEISPTSTWSKHTAAVNDVHFHPLHKFWIGAASDDLSFSIIDTRQPVDKAAISHTEAHTDAVNAIAFHPGFEPILATGSADKSIGLWDLRNLKKKLHSLDIHKDSVVGLEWHPHEKSILASSSYDRRVCVWDLTRIGEEQTPEDAEEGPPELLFMHGGHTNRITEFSWNKNDPWVMCSAAEDNLIECWRPARSIVNAAPIKVRNRDVEDEAVLADYR